MIRGRDIICFSSDWGGHVDSSHHLVRRLMVENRVLWVNSTGLRTPRLSIYDFRRAMGRVSRFGGDTPSKLAPGPVAEYTGPVLPFFGSMLANAYNRWAVGRGLARKVEQLGFRDVIVWACLPTAALFCEDLDPSLVVYYVMDDFPLFPGVDTHSIEALERRLISQSDVLFSTAESLAERKRPYGKEITVLPHGVDFDHFDARDGSLAPELEGIPRPIVGFFGLLAPWIDMDLLTHAARSNPDLSFVSVGDVRTDVAEFRELPNSFLLPEVPYASLPAFARGFNVSVMPFHVDEMTVNVNPLKLLEYLAVGSPVVSTRLPAVEAFEPHVRIVDDAESFAQSLREVLENDTGERRAARKAVAQANSWDARIEEASKVIESALLRKIR